MVFWIKHKFQSAKADGTDVTLVKPSNWNEDHDMYMEEGTIIGRPPGSGPGPPMEIPISSLTPTGLISAFGGAVAPAGWLLCQGQSLLRADHPALFAVIGGTYGAVDATHFSLPDLRGRVAAGADAGAGRLGTIIGGNLGASGGQEVVQYYADVNVWGSARGYGATGGEAITAHTWGGTDGGNQTQYGGVLNNGDVAHGYHVHNVDIWGNAYGAQSAWVDTSISSAGGGYTRADTNIQPTAVVNYIIKV